MKKDIVLENQIDIIFEIWNTYNRENIETFFTER